MGKIILTEELLDWIAEEFEQYKKEDNELEMNFEQYKDFKLWLLENEHKMNRHAWLKDREV